jgi:colicin import membrane protein
MNAEASLFLARASVSQRAVLGSLLGHVVVVGLSLLLARLSWSPDARVVPQVQPIQTVLVEASALRRPARSAVKPVVTGAEPVVTRPVPAVVAPPPMPQPTAAPSRKPRQRPPVALARALTPPAAATSTRALVPPQTPPAAAVSRAAAQARLTAEAALEAQLSAETSRATALAHGGLDEWNLRVRERVESNWYRPATARRGLHCRVAVTLVPGGTVVSAVVEDCNGDAAVRESLRTAVLRSSPLPMPQDARLFERQLVLEFTPDD